MFIGKRRRRLRKSEKDALFKAQNGLCYYCGEAMHKRPEHPDDFNRDPKWCCVDHKVPFALGGETNMENCVVACRSCNSRKHMSIGE